MLSEASGDARGAQRSRSVRPVRVLLVDPSLFTAPYDAALTQGLLANGVHPSWAVRRTRPGEVQPIPAQFVEPLFYRHVDEAPWLPTRARKWVKGVAHVWGLARLALRTWQSRPDVVHFQWTVLPTMDALAMGLFKANGPVVLTVHDTTAFNGDRLPTAQTIGFDWPMRVADRIIVHTQSARETLVRRGVPVAKIAVIPHGPLPLLATPSRIASERRDGRYTIVLFGELKPYKGIDILVESIAHIPSEVRARARFIVAGRPRMDLDPLVARIRELSLESVIELRPRRLADQELVDLLTEANCFVFPYRQIDASGAYFLVASLGKWIVASRVGVFSEELVDKRRGSLVPPNDVYALASSLSQAIESRPIPEAFDTVTGWAQIGRSTRSVYLIDDP